MNLKKMCAPFVLFFGFNGKILCIWSHVSSLIVAFCQYNTSSVFSTSCHSTPDNTASIVARRRQFSQAEQDLYQLPVVVRDGGEPVLSSTSTLTLRVCVCQRGGSSSSSSSNRVRACQVPAFLSTAGLSTGAFIAILLCIIILLGKRQEKWKEVGGRGHVEETRWEREREGGRERERERQRP